MALGLLVPFIAATLLVMPAGSASTSQQDKLAAALLSKGAYSCFANGLEYEHGEVFSIGDSPCLKYRCNDGSYELHEEGCEMWGRCWAVNETYEHKCQLYKCFATYVAGGLKTYIMRMIVDKMCRDHSGKCRRPGEEFDFLMEGEPRKRCYCTVDGESFKYHCYEY